MSDHALENLDKLTQQLYMHIQIVETTLKLILIHFTRAPCISFSAQRTDDCSRIAICNN